MPFGRIEPAMKPIHHLLALAALTCGTFVSATDVPTQALGTKDTLVFSDDFERVGLGPAWESVLTACAVGVSFWLVTFWMYRNKFFVRIGTPSSHSAMNRLKKP
jgi:hypothetical protein